MSESIQAYEAWKEFTRENIRFLGYGDPHIPDQEERTFHAFTEGFKRGVRLARKDREENL